MSKFLHDLFFEIASLATELVMVKLIHIKNAFLQYSCEKAFFIYSLEYTQPAFSTIPFQGILNAKIQYLW